MAQNVSQARQNYDNESEAGVNKLINMCLYGSYVYQSMAFYFDRDDIALGNFHTFLKKLSDDKNSLAQKLMSHQNKRGGRIMLQNIAKPDRDEWGTGLVAMEAALGLSKTINQAYLDVHKVASAHGDANLTDFLEGEFLEGEVDLIKKLSNHVTNLKRVGPGLGEYMFNQESLE